MRHVGAREILCIRVRTSEYGRSGEVNASDRQKVFSSIRQRRDVSNGMYVLWSKNTIWLAPKKF